ncbi:MAG: hypothetical protein KGI59_03560, partial [Patescibacteria group bacterium]|nr:hypothetical protein [Patescibacteria group bacterium]
MNISTAPVQGKIGQALSFLGTNPFVNITENSHLPVFNTTGYSVALWFKYTGPANTGNNPVLFGESQSGGSAKAAMNMRLNTACVLAVFIRNDALTTMLDPSTVYSNRNFCIDGTTNDWHHVVWVDAHGTATMYIDGVA